MKPNPLYARLELLDIHPAAVEPESSARQHFWGESRDRLKQWGSAVLRYFTRSMEPHVTRKRDRDGHVYFAVYDPYAQQHHTFVDETELRVWLEQRYYTQ